MTTHKFRCWIRKEMVYSQDFALNDFFDIYTAIPDNDKALMLFTGFQDINGKDVYEGDIIYFHEKIMFIAFRGGCFYACDDKLDYAFLFSVDNSGIKTTGNIHAHPEILSGDGWAKKAVDDINGVSDEQ